MYKNIGLVLLLSLSISWQATGQILIQHHKNDEDGLPYSQILNMVEDRNGYLWIGTISGLSRWDGVEFKNYGQDDGLGSTDIQSSCIDQEGDLFIGTRRGVYRFVNDRFELLSNLPAPLKGHIEALHIHLDNTLLMATPTGVWAYKEQKFLEILDSKGESLAGCMTFAPGKAGLYLGSDQQGVQIYQNERLDQMILPQGLSVKHIRSVFESSSGILYIGTAEGLFIIQEQHVSHFDQSNGLPGNFVNQVSQVPDGRVFVATSKGVGVFQEALIGSTITRQNGLSNNFVWCIYVSRLGIVYFGTDGGGFDYFRPGVWTTFNQTTGLPHDTVWTVLESQDGSFYFGTEQGIAHYDGQNMETWTTSKGLSEKQILCSHQGSDGNLYFGNNYHGVDVLRNQQFVNLSQTNGLSSNCIWTINRDRKGRIFLGTYGGGICVLEGDKVHQIIRKQDGLPSDLVVSSYAAPDGSLFFGTDGEGAVEIRDGNPVQTYLPGCTVWSIYKNSVGNLFFGTDEKGLATLINSEWSFLTMAEGLSNNCVLGILEDNQSRLYLATDKGLNVLDFSKENVSIRVLGRKDGLPGNEFNQGAFLKSRDGSLWFGSTKGVTKYRPWLEKPNPFPPKTYIKNVKLFGHEIPMSRMNPSTPFGYNENHFQFEYIGVYLPAPEKVIYRYKLGKIDADWIQSRERRIQYTNLNPGHYQFLVKTSHDGSHWSDPTALEFSISPPFWRTWWFVIFCLVLVGSLGWYLIALRIEKLLAIERLRSRIAADLHDDIGAGLSEISILSAVIETKIPKELIPTIQRELQKIGAVSRSLVESMSDIVWLVNPNKDSFCDLFVRLADSFADLFELKQIEFHSTSMKELERIKLSMEYRQHLFLIFKEVLHNAVKYSQCSRLDLQVEYNHGTVFIQISDNGIGFDRSKVRKGNGLTNMMRRAEKLHGSLTLESSPGRGTTITFRGKTT